MQPARALSITANVSPPALGARRQRRDNEGAAAMKPTSAIAMFKIAAAASRPLTTTTLAAACCFASALPLLPSGPTLRTSGSSTAGAGSPASGAPQPGSPASVGQDLPDRAASGRSAPAADGLRNISAKGADIGADSLAFGAQRLHAAAPAPDVARPPTSAAAAPEISALDQPDAGTFVVLLVTALAVIAFVAGRREA